MNAITNDEAVKAIVARTYSLDEVGGHYPAEDNIAGGHVVDQLEEHTGIPAHLMRFTREQVPFAALRQPSAVRFANPESEGYVREMIPHLNELPPAIVSERDGVYDEHDGHHRRAAHELAGHSSYPAFVLHEGTTSERSRRQAR